MKIRHNEITDTFESYGFKWYGKYHCLGFYRIRNYNNYYYLEKFLGYKYNRPEYNHVCSIYINDDVLYWFTYDVSDDEWYKFVNAIKKSSRDTKLKNLHGYFKHSEDFYASKHQKN